MLTKEEAAALLKILAEAEWTGLGAFARLDYEEEAAAYSAEAKLKLIAKGE